jgi:hypothetical protein
MNDTVFLGYEMGTGRHVNIPIRHMVVTGITQESGKTTTLEALAGRSGRPVLCFRTKRGEEAFATARTIPARVVPSAEWPDVESLLLAMLSHAGTQETLKSMRYTLVRACESAASLADVSKNLAVMMCEEKTESARRQAYLLNSYLQSIMEDLRAAGDSVSIAAPAAGAGQVDVHTEVELDLQPGVQCMDVSGLPYYLQAAAIAYALDWIGEHAEGVVTIIPEAWEMLPRDHATPCRLAAERLLRKGACCGNVLWLDAQDLAALYPPARKACSVYLLGVQRADMEVARTLRHLRSAVRCPTAEQIMELQRGWFYRSGGEEMDLVYVQPAWLDAYPDRARRYAQEPLPESYVSRPKSKRQTKRRAIDGSGDRARRARQARPEPEAPTIETMPSARGVQ